MQADQLSADEIFSEALLRQGAERANYLDEVLGHNAAARDRMERLLRAHADANSFLESPAADVLNSPPRPGEGLGEGLSDTRHLTPDALLEGPGTVIGPYKLLQQIGEGGMGVVFMAEQAEPIQRTVALKIIKPGMDTRQVIARFEAERQAVAMMDHPNIARVLDAGATASGRPYFVMDLVKGVPITEYSDAQHLSVAERLELMVGVCQAVQHAHQKGIIHRDLKPSNVLVAEYDGRPTPKIIDFGVAKAIAQPLTEKTVFTQYGQIVGTFEYMSPEQARFNQLDVDTRSDIYSLGVLFYEVLVGSTPLEKDRIRSAAFDEILRIISEEEPPLPSARLSSSESLPSIAANRSLEPKKLTGLVSGELDWIVMKCLEKERDKRYSSAEQVADEFRRFLAGEPIQARPITTPQRMWRWYRRHAALVAGSYTVLTFAINSLMYIVMFSILQFLIGRPTATQLLSSLGLTAFAVFVCLLCAESGIAAFRGRSRGLWVSLIAFIVFSIGQSCALYWAIGTSREISDVPVYSISAVNPGSIAGRSAYVRNSVIGYALLQIIWAYVGVALQVHALSCRAADRKLGVRRRTLRTQTGP